MQSNKYGKKHGMQSILRMKDLGSIRQSISQIRDLIARRHQRPDVGNFQPFDVEIARKWIKEDSLQLYREFAPNAAFHFAGGKNAFFSESVHVVNSW